MWTVYTTVSDIPLCQALTLEEVWTAVLLEMTGMAAELGLVPSLAEFKWHVPSVGMEDLDNHNHTVFNMPLNPSGTFPVAIFFNDPGFYAVFSS